MHTLIQHGKTSGGKEGRKEIRCVELGRRGKGREKGDNVWDPRVCVWRERVEGVVGIWRVKK